MRILLLAISFLAANSAVSGSKFDRLDKFYLGGGVSAIDVGANGSDLDLSYSSLEIIGGYKYSGFLSLDARLTLGNDSGDDSGDTKLYTGSVYWRPETANEIAKTYGLLGFTAASIRDSDDSYSRSGFSYGAGIGFTITEAWNINFEVRKVLDHSDLDLETFSAHIDYRF
ncbi:MAG: porin family protein [Agarilytica sp.]